MGLLHPHECADLSYLIPHCPAGSQASVTSAAALAACLLEPCDPADPVMFRVLSGSF